MESLSQLYRSEAAYENAMRHYDTTLEKWQIKPQSLYVETGFGQTHILRVGDPSKPPFIFFHGWNGNAAGTYLEVDIVRLANYFCLHFPDTLGQSGKSAPTRPNTGDRSFGEWASDIFNALEFEEVYVSGISGGGFIALKACVYAPEKVKKAFLMCPGGLVDLSRFNWQYLITAVPAALGFEWGGRYLVRKMLSPDFTDKARIYEMGEGMRETLNSLIPVMGPKALTDQELERIQCPVYIVSGKHDIVVPPRQTIKRANRLISDVTTQLVHAGHMITIEKFDWLTDEMLRFFGMEIG